MPDDYIVGPCATRLGLLDELISRRAQTGKDEWLSRSPADRGQCSTSPLPTVAQSRSPRFFKIIPPSNPENVSVHTMVIALPLAGANFKFNITVSLSMDKMSCTPRECTGQSDERTDVQMLCTEFERLEEKQVEVGAARRPFRSEQGSSFKMTGARQNGDCEPLKFQARWQALSLLTQSCATTPQSYLSAKARSLSGACCSTPGLL